MNTELMFSADTVEWETDDELFEQFRAEFDLEVDVCSSATNHKLPYFWTKEDNCLSKEAAVPWTGRRLRCWMNPPYGEPEQPCRKNCKKKRCRKRGHCVTEYVPGCYDFLKWAHGESLKGSLFVCLLPARTDTAWYHEFCKRHTRRFFRGRLKFKTVRPDGSVVDNPAPFPSMLVIMRPPQATAKYQWDEVLPSAA
jgi:phage N-6-adenine-methyltransferase